MIVDGSSGDVRESWTGDQVAWPMARGYEGQFGHVLNAPYVWLPLCAIFLLGLVDWRRPWRIAHLDLLALLAFGVSHVFFNRGEIGVSVPLVYPVLAYLLARMLWLGFRGGAAASTRLPRGLARDRRRLPDRLPGDDQRRRLRGDRRRLRGDGRRGPHCPRPADLRRGRVPRGQPLRRHLRALQLLRVRAVRAGAALERRVGRARRLPRRRDRVRPRRGRRTVRLRPAASARTSRPRARVRSSPSPGSPTRIRPSPCSRTRTTR